MGATLVGTAHSLHRVSAAEQNFYALYEWCLNPVLSVSEIFQRLREEFDRYDDLRVDWQRQESAINLYLFICAIACTVDDYLAWRPWNLAPVVARFPRLRRGTALLQSLLNAPWSMLHLIGDASIGRWRRQWGWCVDLVCEMLVRQERQTAEPSDAGQQCRALRAMVNDLAKSGLPERLLRQRMRLPEGFRCQDLTHHDVFYLAQRFADRQRNTHDRLVIIGPRTAGAYFAPLIKAYLAPQGWLRVSWMTVRPKMGVSWLEWQALRRLTRDSARILLVDDHPNTGATFQLMLGILKRLRIPAEQITILAPRHPAERGRPLLKDAGIAVIRLAPEEFYKARMLGGRWAEARIREYHANWDTVWFRQTKQVDAVNAQLQEHYSDGFHVRLKRLFDVELRRTNGTPIVRRLCAKSVGWGWLGYHAYIAGVRLADCVPRVVGLRDGVLITEWVGDFSHPKRSLPGDSRVTTLSSYVAKRSQRLRLAGDPCFRSIGYRWNGWDEIITLLRGAYGGYISRLKVSALRQQLQRYVCPVPTLVDGQVRPDEWIATPLGFRKVDFEHHNFGGAEKDIVDPAWDLASAAFEFALSEQEEQELLHSYARESGDRTIFDRFILYRLLYGVHSMHLARDAIARHARRPESWNQRYLRARDFLVCGMNRFLVGPAGRPAPTGWTKRLFFLDLDGVLDCERLGFPHTTPSGLASLELLRRHGFSVVLNTGRSVDHVRAYCQIYGLPGGIAEYGSVFVDAVAKDDVPLLDPTAVQELARCRAAIRKMPGLFIDDGYRHSIRVYRWHRARTMALAASEIQDILTRSRCDRLAVIPRLDDSTHIVQKGNSKGAALVAVKSRLGCANEPAAAIGDSERDLDMLGRAEWSYAPANCAKAIRDLAKSGRCRVMPQPFQRGLLAAVRDLLSAHALATGGVLEPASDRESSDLLRALLRVAERPVLRQLAAVLDWQGL